MLLPAGGDRSFVRGHGAKRGCESGCKMNAMEFAGLASQRNSIDAGAEGVGFEPTVPLCGTLDFESSALNRTQPPFLGERQKTLNGPSRTGGNVQHRTSNATRILTPGISFWAFNRYSIDETAAAGRSARARGEKCYNLILDLTPVCTAYCVLARWRPQHLVISGHCQLLTGYW